MHLRLVVRRVVYSLIVCGVILGVVGAGARFVERRGWISLDTPDSSITHLPDAPYVRDGQWYVTAPNVRSTMIQTRFRATKGDAFRMFVLGESFAMGTPYVMQTRADPGEGGIATWLTADLEALFPSSPIEIINSAAGAQNSHRVSLIGKHVVQLEPDAILIAACNNEGVLPPARMNQMLHNMGAYRLLEKLTLPEVPREKRSYYTPQDPDVEAIRSAFAANLRTIVEAARQHDVAVLLCTMPVNLRYSEDHLGHLAHDVDPAVKARPPTGCTLDAVDRLFKAGDAAEVIDILRGCKIDLDGLRTLGLALFADGRYAAAHAVLNNYTELMPRNRCRPSLNQVIRDQAEATPWVHLVDLEAAAETMSPGGIPGSELFLDYCHMNWAGYAAMADVVRDVMLANGIVPRGPRATVEQRPSRIELANRFGLPEDPHTDVPH